jgi:hypothetical protein
MKQKIYTWDEWVNKYKPLFKDPEGDMHYEVRGKDGDYVRKHEDKYIWTYHDDCTVTAGYHWFNRLGYYITKVPHEYTGKFALVFDPDYPDHKCFIKNLNGLEQDTKLAVD